MCFVLDLCIDRFCRFDFRKIYKRRVFKRFESLQERRENFLLQGRLSVLTLISVSVPPPCYRSST